MKKNKWLGWIIISAGLILAVLIMFSDILRGRTFYFGLSQALLLILPLLMVIFGWLVGYQLNKVRAIGKIVNLYFTKQWIQIKESITRKNILILGILIIVFSLMVFFYYTTGTPIVRAFPDYIGSGSTVTLLQFVIVLFAALICILPSFLSIRAQRNKWINILISILVFFAAYKLWTSLPIATNWLMREVNSDPLVIYPFSDPRRYDINVLALLNGKGYGFGTPIQRPFYTFFWTILHILFNHNYVDMIFAQIVFFSVLPVMAYHLGYKFGGNVTGIVMAGMIIFHEYNQIILSSQYTMISVQMIMSEIFIELFLIILTFITMIWLQDNQSTKKALMAGTAFGLVILLRTQTVVFFAVFLLYFFYFRFWKKEKVGKAYLFFLLSVVIIITPWLTRNYIQNGYFSMDDPKYFNTVFTGNGDNELFTGVETGEGGSLSDNMKLYFFNRTGDLLIRTGVFFCNDIANSIYQFPWTTQFNSLEEYVNSGASPFPHPYEKLNTTQIWLAGLHVLLILIGLTAAINRYQFPGIVPALFYSAYSLSGDIFGYTAHRFIQPVEWIFFLYWGLGFAVLLSLMLPKSVILSLESGFKQSRENKMKIAGNVWIGSALLIAILIPALEVFITQRAISVPNLEKAQLAIDADKLTEVLPVQENPVLIDDDFTALNGFALFPLYLKDADDWYHWHFDYRWYVRDYDKVFEWSDEFIKSQLAKNVDILLFQLMNGSFQDIIVDDPQINVEVKNPYLFNNAETFIYGCVRENYIEAYYVQIVREGLYYEISSGKPIPLNCADNK